MSENKLDRSAFLYGVYLSWIKNGVLGDEKKCRDLAKELGYPQTGIDDAIKVGRPIYQKRAAFHINDFLLCDYDQYISKVKKEMKKDKLPDKDCKAILRMFDERTYYCRFLEIMKRGHPELKDYAAKFAEKHDLPIEDLYCSLKENNLVL